jgi:hypothetical protein
LLIRIILSCLMFILPASLCSMEFTVERFDLRPIRAPTLQVTATGEIRGGDTEKLKATINSVDQTGVRDVLFIFNSPGGSLVESLEMGAYIADLPAIVSAQVGASEMEGAICASACVYAYLAADYRYISANARIGIHQFGLYDVELDGNQGAAIGQVMSGVLSEYIRTHRAGPELFEAISGTGHDDILWIPRQQLEDWRVVTNDVYDEREYYINLNGKIALRLKQVAITGDSFLTLICAEGSVAGLADLHEPELAAYGEFEVAIDDAWYPVATWDVVDRSDGRGRILFELPPGLQRAAMSSSKIGARMVAPSGDIFFGFQQTLRDGLVPEMIRGCAGATPSATSGMVDRPATDFPGNDLTRDGFRGISFARCKEICLEYEDCRAVSYVQARSWCWPKGQASGAISKPGVISAIKR